MPETAVLMNEPEIEFVPETCARATSEQLRRMEAEIALQVLPLAEDPEGTPVVLRTGRREIVLIPIDTRRFVEAMRRHICFN